MAVGHRPTSKRQRGVLVCVVGGVTEVTGRETESLGSQGFCSDSKKCTRTGVSDEWGSRCVKGQVVRISRSRSSTGTPGEGHRDEWDSVSLAGRGPGGNGVNGEMGEVSSGVRYVHRDTADVQTESVGRDLRGPSRSSPSRM